MIFPKKCTVCMAGSQCVLICHAFPCKITNATFLYLISRTLQNFIFLLNLVWKINIFWTLIFFWLDFEKQNHTTLKMGYWHSQTRTSFSDQKVFCSSLRIFGLSTLFSIKKIVLVFLLGGVEVIPAPYHPIKLGGWTFNKF